ncbi:MAG: S1C family serine protease [Thermoguttaceae bacterium]
MVWLLFAAASVLAADVRDSNPLTATLGRVQPKMVKIYGAGGPKGLEHYQSAFLISSDGYILTAWSHVLDTDDIIATLFDGRKFKARLVGADPRLEIAVLKIDAADLSCFDLGRAVEADLGTRVLAVSNLFNVAEGNEPQSVQHGTISARTRLEARRGVFETPYSGPVYALDVVTNNPGAAGGALVTWQGDLVGMLGKELRNSLNNTWLNYALPIAELRTSVAELRAGKFVVRKTEEGVKKPARALTPALLGLVLVPDVMERTPPFVDEVLPDSSAAKVGIQPDDLIVLVENRLVPSCKMFCSELGYIDCEDKVKITVLRAQEMHEFELQAAENKKGSP